MSGPILGANELHQHVGQTFVSHWFLLDQDRIDAFAKSPKTSSSSMLTRSGPPPARWRTGS